MVAEAAGRALTWTSPTSCAIGMQRAGRPAADGRACRSPAHVAVLAALHVRAAAAWLAARTTPPQTVMTISLGGGGDGPENGGMTPIGGRPVRRQTPPDEAAEARSGPAAGGEDAGDDGAAADARSRSKATPRRP